MHCLVGDSNYGTYFLSELAEVMKLVDTEGINS